MNWIKAEKKWTVKSAIKYLIDEDVYRNYETKGDIVAFVDEDYEVYIMTGKEVIASVITIEQQAEEK